MLGKLKAMISAAQFRIFTRVPIKGVMLKITGNGALDPTIQNSYNISSVVRVGVGVYRCTLTQSTFYGYSVLDNGAFSTGFSIVPSVTTDSFSVNVTTVSAGVYDINVFAVTQGAGNKLALIAYDFLGTDSIDATFLLNYGDGRLPPA